MDCPFCGKEMREGKIPSRDVLKWWDKDADLLTADASESVLLSSMVQDAQAYFCPDCRQIILPVREVEGVLDVMERKLSAVGDKIEAVQKQWEARRAEKQKEKQIETKRKNIREKDPWEL